MCDILNNNSVFVQSKTLMQTINKTRVSRSFRNVPQYPEDLSRYAAVPGLISGSEVRCEPSIVRNFLTY